MSYLESHSPSNQIRNWLKRFFPFRIRNFPNWKFVCWSFMWVNSRLRSGGEDRELPPTTAVLSAFAVEPRVLSCKPRNRDSKKDRLWEYINRYQIHDCWKWERGRAVSFLGIYVSKFWHSVYSLVAQGKQTVVHDLLYAWKFRYGKYFLCFLRRHLQIFIGKFIMFVQQVAKIDKMKQIITFAAKCLCMSPYTVPTLFYIVVVPCVEVSVRKK
jgi:hypothetical protein